MKDPAKKTGYIGCQINLNLKGRFKRSPKITFDLQTVDVLKNPPVQQAWESRLQITMTFQKGMPRFL